MSNIQLFENEQFGAIRTIMHEDEPWFVAADVCKALDHTNVTMALDRLDDDERAKFNLGRQGETNVVNEPGLYTLILGSRKPEAKAFKRWITHEVLPALRKHGVYATGSVTSALTELHSALSSVHALLDDLEQRMPIGRANSLTRVLMANAAGDLTPQHFEGCANKARKLVSSEKIARRIHIALIEEDMTVQQLADMVGVDKRSVYRWCNGQYIPGKKLSALLKFLNCDVSDVLL